MSIYNVYESSPDSILGSQTKDLVQSKKWLIHCLEQLGLDSFDHIYCLGSWYGLLGSLLVDSDLQFSHLYMIDWDKEKSDYVAQKSVSNKRVHSICMDVNRIRYVGESICVINTSTNDIEGRNWFTSIPSGSLVVLQGKDHQDLSNGEETLERFNKVYPLSQTLYLGSLVVEGIDSIIYNRFMKIGTK